VLGIYHLLTFEFTFLSSRVYNFIILTILSLDATLRGVPFHVTAFKRNPFLRGPVSCLFFFFLAPPLHVFSVLFDDSNHRYHSSDFLFT